MIKTRDRIASGLGSVLEWYDFALYGFFAPLLAHVFFPNNLPSIAILKSFAVFAIGFIARPIGPLIFGFIADKYGRTKSLKITPLLITLPTFGIAILPTYQKKDIIIKLALFKMILLKLSKRMQNILSSTINSVIFLSMPNNRGCPFYFYII